MKINKYQKVVLIWGFLLFTGFTFSQFSASLEQMFIVWTIVIALALFSQFYFMWWNTKAVAVSQLTWLIVSLGGSLFTYVAVMGIVVTSIKLSVFWLWLTAAGMVVTGISQKNKSYYLLALLYLVAGVILQLVTTQYDILFTGIIFLAFGILDAMLEYSPMRRKLADFAPKNEEFLPQTTPVI